MFKNKKLNKREAKLKGVFRTNRQLVSFFWSTFKQNLSAMGYWSFKKTLGEISKKKNKI